MKSWVVTIIGIVIILGSTFFFLLDVSLGEKQKTKEWLTVTDTYTRFIGGRFSIRKFYVTVKTKEGEKTFSVTHELFDEIEKNNEIEVTITIVHTKWTNSTELFYSIEN